MVMIIALCDMVDRGLDLVLYSCSFVWEHLKFKAQRYTTLVGDWYLVLVLNIYIYI